METQVISTRSHKIFVCVGFMYVYNNINFNLFQYGFGVAILDIFVKCEFIQK
jgi:hypothetical protein